MMEASQATCEGLLKVNFSTIQDAPADITAANWVAAKGDVSMHCEAEHMSASEGLAAGVILGRSRTR
jgi:hypothetical protein